MTFLLADLWLTFDVIASDNGLSRLDCFNYVQTSCFQKGWTLIKYMVVFRHVVHFYLILYLAKTEILVIIIHISHWPLIL